MVRFQQFPNKLKGDDIIASGMIDAGHGGKDPGAIGFGVNEKDIALQVSKLVELKLKRSGITPYMTRQNDSFVELIERANKANKLKTDVFVSIHCNSYNSQAKGIETYAYKEQYKSLAESVHKELVNSKCYTVNRGVKFANYSVLRNTNMSACLVELGFIDNKEDFQILQSKQDELATAIAKGICNHLGVSYTGGSTSNTLYVVATGAYKDVNNAKKDVENLKAKGIDAYVHIHEGVK